MSTTQRTQSISVNEDLREVHFTIGGEWDLAGMKAFLHEMNAKSAPLVESGGPIYGLGVMTDMVPANDEVYDYIRNHLMASKEAGLCRVAIIDPPMLVKLSYKKLSEGLEVEYFYSKDKGLNWLRENR
ncbi:hypothetical protein [Aurantiacibacter sp. MUD61]|uniref:hypothetical protein n=1 Tax=Aurantiacibacter sp. MUD61 TaxID=3009083 RepID=UPI0022F11DBB|nr:hypothetical protein [Aurantiacibacter sp. MUD61]